MKDDRPPLSRDAIVAQAIALADADGLAKLSMRKLAAQMGVEAMSLYNHLRGKADLMDAMTDAVVGEIDPPRPRGDWKVEMTRRARSARAVLLRHPWAAQLVVAQSRPGPRTLAYTDATIGCLVGAGFSYPMADEVWHAVDSHIHGFVLQELNFPFAQEDYATAAQAHLEMIPAETYPHLRRMAEMVASGAHDGINDFELGLGILLDGFDRLRDAA